MPTVPDARASISAPTATDSRRASDGDTRALVVAIASGVDEGAASRHSVTLENLYATLGATGGLDVASIAAEGPSAAVAALRLLLDASHPRSLVIVGDGERLDLEALEDCLAGLEGAPEAVVAVTGLLWMAPAAILDVETRDWRQPNPLVHEGRKLARLVTERAVTVASWAGVVLRSSALGSDLPRPLASRLDDPAPAAPSIRGALLLDVLVRGFAWSRRDLGWCERNDAERRHDDEAISVALAHAEAEGLFEDRHREQVGRAPTHAADPVPPGGAPAPGHGAAPLPSPRPPRLRAPLRRFLIAAPDYAEGSGGPVALHLLCDRLNRAGYEAVLALIDPEPGRRAAGLTNPAWLTPIARLDERFESFVAVYPENLVGNPLETPFVVRWLLHRPAYFTGIGMAEGGDDLVLAWHRCIAPGRLEFGLPLTDLATFAPKQRPGSGRLLWVGKGKVPPDLDRTGMTEITRSWPRGAAALASLLRSAEVLVSCDWLTSINDEAVLCGTPVALAGSQEWARGQPMQLADHLIPGAFGCQSGNPTSDEIAQATLACSSYQEGYRRRVNGTLDAADAFVQLVNEHFDRVAARSLALADVGQREP